MKQRLIRFIPLAGFTVLLLVAIFALNTSAERVKTCQSIDVCFQPLVNQPLETLRTIEPPNIAVPIWLNGDEQ